MAATYRIQQGLRALFAFTRPLSEKVAITYLSAAELALFRRLRRGERLHALAVLAALQAEAPVPPALATAALLHDVGKIRCPLHLWQKTVVVLTRALFPAVYARLAAGDPTRWLVRPFVVYDQHPTWSADYLSAAGSDPAAVWLCRHHADHTPVLAAQPFYPLLRRLQAADDTH